MTIAATSLALALGACASAPAKNPVSRDIGPKPADCRPVTKPAKRAGENLFVTAQRARDAVDAANRRLQACGGEWDRARTEFRVGRT